MTPNKNNIHLYSSNKNALEPSTVLTMIVWHMDEPSILMKTHFREETIIYLNTCLPISKTMRLRQIFLCKPYTSLNKDYLYISTLILELE